MKSRYPRYFIPNRKITYNTGYSEIDGDETLYLVLDKFYGDVTLVSQTKRKFETPFTERGCNDFVKNGYWKEIKEEEVALL